MPSPSSLRDMGSIVLLARGVRLCNSHIFTVESIWAPRKTAMVLLPLKSMRTMGNPSTHSRGNLIYSISSITPMLSKSSVLIQPAPLSMLTPENKKGLPLCYSLPTTEIFAVLWKQVSQAYRSEWQSIFSCVFWKELSTWSQKTYPTGI